METPLAYIYQEILRDPKNEERVWQILKALFATDIVWPGKEEEENELLQKLSDMGEDKIYRAAKEAIEARRECIG